MTAPPNPLIAERVDTTPFFAGITLVEGIVDAKRGIEARSWIDMTIGGGFAAFDTALLVMDPLGSMTSWVAAMCMEHIKPLADVLDWLAGDPDQVAANAQTWANVAANTMHSADELADAISREVPQWAGPAADAYRGAAEVEVLALRGYAESAAAKAAAVEMSGRIVLVVRTMVRDLIADLIAALLVRGPMWTAEEAMSLGLATPWVAGQISALCAKWAFRIAKLLDALIESLSRLTALVRQVDESTAAINSRPRGTGNNTLDGASSGQPHDLDRDGRPDADSTGVVDNLPDFSNPEVDPKKITDYVMNPDHPVGGNKYRVINSATGLGPGDALTIDQQIRDGVRHAMPILGKADQYGQRWAVDVVLTGPKGSIVVRTAWILDAGSSTPRLVTVSFP